MTPETSLKVTMPLRTYSEANRREHWAARMTRVRNQRALAYIYVQDNDPLRAWSLNGRIEISLVRVASRALDSDNLASALKAVRDGVADALGRNDGDPCITWNYSQEKGKRGEYAVRIEITTSTS